MMIVLKANTADPKSAFIGVRMEEDKRKQIEVICKTMNVRLSDFVNYGIELALAEKAHEIGAQHGL